MSREIAVIQGRFETPRTTGSFELIPRIARVDGGRGCRVGWLADRLFTMVTSGVFETFLGMANGMDQRDQRGNRDKGESDENEG